MKKITLLLMALLLPLCMSAKTRTTTLWTGTSINDTEIHLENSKFTNAESGDVLRITFSFTTAGSMHLCYKTGEGGDWAAKAFNGISEWPYFSDTSVSSAEFSINATDLTTLQSYGMYIYGFSSSTITKIELIHTFQPTSVSDNLLTEDWASSKETAKILSAVSDARIGDVLQFTVSTTAAWTWVQFKLTDKDGNVDQFTGEGSELQGNNGNTSFTLEFVISTVADLVKIMSDGFGVIQTGDNAFTLTAVKLLSYSDSHDAVEEVVMGSDRIMTYSNIYNLDFSDTGLTPYYTTSATTGKVTLTPVPDKTTWNYQGYILKGEEGTYYPKVIGNNSGTYPTGNLLKGNTGENTIAASTTGKYHYIFAKDSEDNKIGFFNLAAPYTLGAHKAYLETSTNIKPGQSSSRIALVFDDGETTGIQELENSSIEELNHSGNEALKAYYNLNGQRVANPRKGLYVVNGKKVIIK